MLWICTENGAVHRAFHNQEGEHTMPHDPQSSPLRPSASDDSEIVRVHETDATSARTRGSGSSGDGNDEPKTGRDVPKAE
jgi:hypothetical protein